MMDEEYHNDAQNYDYYENIRAIQDLVGQKCEEIQNDINIKSSAQSLPSLQQLHQEHTLKNYISIMDPNVKTCDSNQRQLEHIKLV